MFSMLIMAPLKIDTRSPVPSYRQLANQLRERIEAGQIGPDEQLPSITYIQQETGLAVGTIRQGIALLVEEGVAYTVPGRGTFADPETSAGHDSPGDTCSAPADP